ncbi:MAG: hypothetical protein U5K37_12790 [Natrialbaceae archaeon]|nr:hypothetical protein [Natrialbaceae archaeon]
MNHRVSSRRGRCWHLVGRRGVGDSTLLREFIQHRIEAGDAPERILFAPFDADPRFQLRSDEQLRRAVRYYESRILGKTRGGRVPLPAL